MNDNLEQPINQLRPTASTFVIHAPVNLECISKEYDEETDSFVVTLHEVDAQDDDASRIVFHAPPGDAAEKFAVGRRYYVDAAIT